MLKREEEAARRVAEKDRKRAEDRAKKKEVRLFNCFIYSHVSHSGNY